jgi:hypothetical protein
MLRHFRTIDAVYLSLSLSHFLSHRPFILYTTTQASTPAMFAAIANLLRDEFHENNSDTFVRNAAITLFDRCMSEETAPRTNKFYAGAAGLPMLKQANMTNNGLESNNKSRKHHVRSEVRDRFTLIDHDTHLGMLPTSNRTTSSHTLRESIQMNGAYMQKMSLARMPEDNDTGIRGTKQHTAIAVPSAADNILALYILDNYNAVINSVDEQWAVLRIDKSSNNNSNTSSSTSTADDVMYVFVDKKVNKSFFGNRKNNVACTWKERLSKVRK